MRTLAGIRFVIWGLRNSRHSHRYIHKGFYETLRRLDLEVLWLDNFEKNQEFIRPGDFVLAVGLADNFLPVSHKVKYVLHNVDNPRFQDAQNKIHLQVFTIDAKGEKIDETVSLWDEKEKTLYQPWGLAEPREDWLTPRNLKSKKKIGLVQSGTINCVKGIAKS